MTSFGLKESNNYQPKTTAYIKICVVITYLMWESYMSKMESGTIKGNLSMYMKTLLRFSLVTVAISTTSLLSVNTQRSPEFTLFRLSRQNGHDCDIVRLQNTPNHLTFNWTKNTLEHMTKGKRRLLKFHILG